MIVTTSWGDGNPLDIRLAEILASHGLRGTFYVPLRNADFPYGGILHFWGQSWEIEKHNLWSLLEEILKDISSHPNVLYLTNSQVLDVTRSC